MKSNLGFRLICLIAIFFVLYGSAIAKKGDEEEPPPVPGPADLKALLAADWACWMSSYRFKGLGLCTKNKLPVACVRYGHKYPTGIAESVAREPGDTDVQNPTSMLSMALLIQVAKTAVKAVYGFAMGQGTGGSGTTTQKASPYAYMEAHVYTFPDWVKLIEEASKKVPYLYVVYLIAKFGVCSPDQGIFLSPLYYTESDFMFWKTGVQDVFKVMSFQLILNGAQGCTDASVPGSDTIPTVPKIPGSDKWCLGNFGNIYPRTGTSIHWNEPTVAYHIGFRAFSMAYKGGAIKIGDYLWEAKVGSYVQEAEPISGSCSPYGGNYYFHDGFKSFASDGIYWYIHWPELQCCVPCSGTEQAD